MEQIYIWNSSGIVSCPRPIERAEVLPDDEEDEYLIDDDQDD